MTSTAIILLLSAIIVILSVTATHYYFEYEGMKIDNGVLRRSRDRANDALSTTNQNYERLHLIMTKTREKMANEALDNILRDKHSEQETKTVSKFMVN